MASGSPMAVCVCICQASPAKPSEHWLSAFSLGNFVGPTLAGCLVQTEGFRRTTMIFFGLYAVMIIIDLIEAFHAIIFRLFRYIYIQFSLEQHTTIKTPWCLQKQLRGDAINVVFKSHQ